MNFYSVSILLPAAANVGAARRTLKAEIEDGVYKVNSKWVAMRHRLSIGTITSEPSIRGKMVKWWQPGQL